MTEKRFCRLVLDEEENEIKFESNFGRDEFIKSVLKSVDNELTNDDLKELSELFKDL